MEQKPGGDMAESGFTCPLCWWEKSSSTWSKTQRKWGPAHAQGPGGFCKAPLQQVLVSHQNLAEILDQLSSCKPLGFVTFCSSGHPTGLISGIFFPLFCTAVMAVRIRLVPWPAFHSQCPASLSHSIRILSPGSLSSACSLA